MGWLVAVVGLGLYQRHIQQGLNLTLGWLNTVLLLLFQLGNAVAVLRRREPGPGASLGLAVITFVFSAWEANVLISYRLLKSGEYVRVWQSIYLAGLVISMASTISIFCKG
jgi:hypothetical protein